MNIHDEILMLRALEPTDLEVLYRWENDVKLWHTCSTITPFSRKQLWDYIEGYDGDIFKSRQLRLMIEEISTKGVVGTIDLYDFDPVNNRASVGILLTVDFQGRGYGKRAMRLFEKYCETFLPINQLICVVAEDNEASLRLFRTLGYREVGVLKWWLKRGNVYNNALLFQKKIW